MYNYFIGVLYFQQIEQKILKVMYFENIEESSRFILTINISHPRGYFYGVILRSNFFIGMSFNFLH